MIELIVIIIAINSDGYVVETDKSTEIYPSYETCNIVRGMLIEDHQNDNYIMGCRII